MTVEVRPLGVSCNINCQYCYQQPQRDAKNVPRSYDLEKIKAAVLADGAAFSLFGGEPLLVPKDDLEALWEWGFQHFRRNAIQTNGTMIDDDHIRMFRQYNVHVGISIDGPGSLNDVRWAGSLQKTRAATLQSEASIERLCREGLNPSIILTLHANNSREGNLTRLLDWTRHLDTLGVRSLRLHLLEVESAAVRDKYALTAEDNIHALREFYRLEPTLRTLRLDLFKDMRSMLLADDRQTTCVWNACDPYTTRAVRGVEGQGQRSNCGRTNKDGIDFVKSSEEGFERYLALYQTPQEHGGCKGCRFFLMCKGQCPGTSLDGDWRNRTEYCEVWKALYTDLEQELLDAGRTPLSLAPHRANLEQALLGLWRAQKTRSLHSLQGEPASTPGNDWRSLLRNLSGEVSTRRGHAHRFPVH
jgi:uncharacterized protein